MLVASSVPVLPARMVPLHATPAPQLPQVVSCLPLAGPQAVVVDAVPRQLAEQQSAAGMQLPGMPAWKASDAMRTPHTGAAASDAPEPTETWPTMPERVPEPAAMTPQLRLPVLNLVAIGSRPHLESASEPDLAVHSQITAQPPVPAAPVSGTLAPLNSGLQIQSAEANVEGLSAGLGEPAFQLPEASFAVIDFHCRPTPGIITKRISPMASETPVNRPRFTIRPAFDRWEDLAPPPEPKTSELVVMRKAVVQVLTGKATRHMIGTIAAGLFLGAALYFGAARVRPHRDSLSSAGSVAMNEISSVPATADRVAQKTTKQGAFARFKQAIANRAAVTWSDSFHGGMESWGAQAKSVVPGWSRSADGFVQPGPLALFKPSSTYTDYQLEFFGQIEHKSIDWVVRAQDSQNYYAMKLKVIEEGLRPVIAMVHYNVAGGKRGKSHELPLMNMMVHNSRPVQVLVDVKGNRFTASLDGQQVDSWTDEAPASGAVGFFAEAGEKARLYWMRVSKNEDFLGRICAYFTGSSNDTAGLWPANPAGGPRHGGGDDSFETAQAFGLAGAVTLRRKRMRMASRSAGDFSERRRDSWRPLHKRADGQYPKA
jgi:hypothetical protein